MSSTAIPMNTSEDSVVFKNFLNFMASFELVKPSDESIGLQRLKVLASRSNQFVQFRDLGNSKYLVYTDHDLPIGATNKIGDLTIDELVGFRSAMIRCDDQDCSILNYTIKRVKALNNTDFITLTDMEHYVSYEGTILLVYHDGDEWKIRTTSCPDAYDSKFSSMFSHGQLFVNKLASQFKLHANASLKDIMCSSSENMYYVFMLVADETKYLCDYSDEFDNGKVFLLNVRNSMHEDLTINPESPFASPVPISMEEIQTQLNDESNKTFNKQMLKLQGFMAKGPDGKLYRTFTGAYHYASNLIPNHSNHLITMFHCYLKNSLPTYLALHNMEETVTEHIHLTRGTGMGLRNLMAFLFSIFTNFTVQNVRVTDPKDGTVRNQMIKSYTKRNGDLYNQLFNTTDVKVLVVANVYRKALAMLQNFARTSKDFTDAENLANDVDHFIRNLAFNSTTFSIVTSMLFGYDTFKNHLLASTQVVNDTRKTLPQPQVKGRQNTVPQVKLFSNRFDENIEFFVSSVRQTGIVEMGLNVLTEPVMESTSALASM